ncbi:MAG TPA: hypothetical protein PKC59_02265 [Burkholderiaceae bacterium]|nr:hypothetical protein [Burkholderiaceae bacterium]HNC84771.1 hypothetical protein [Nitrospira sp.]HNG78552.1 hypothetical protein [Burkholderiaceae bacterium]
MSVSRCLNVTAACFLYGTLLVGCTSVKTISADEVVKTANLMPWNVKGVIEGKTILVAEGIKGDRYYGRNFFFVGKNGIADAPLYINQPYQIDGNEICFPRRKVCGYFFEVKEGGRFYREDQVEKDGKIKKGDFLVVRSMEDGDPYDAKGTFREVARKQRLPFQALDAALESSRQDAAAEEKRSLCRKGYSSYCN